MMLLGVKKDGDWLYSEWRLTYPVGWSHIVNAASRLYEYLEKPEIMVGDTDGNKNMTVKDAKEVQNIEECRNMTIRGFSEMIKVPVSITFYNQSDFVTATVACATEEFAEADYKKFNLSMCQLMDSVEFAMY